MSTAVAKKPYAVAIESQKANFIKTAPAMSFDKEQQYALEACSKNPALANCDPKSFGVAMLNIAKMGLTLNPTLGLAYLIPEKGKAVARASYQGKIALALDAGIVEMIEVRAVYTNDTFDMSLGTNPNITHSRARGKKGELESVYGVATMANGQKYIDEMSLEEVEAVAKRSPMNKNGLTGAWLTDKVQMSLKTMVHRMFKYIPKHNIKDEKALERFAIATSIDNSEYEKPTTVDVQHVDVSDVFVGEATEVDPEQEAKQDQKQAVSSASATIKVPPTPSVVVPQPTTQPKTKTPSVS